VVPTTGEQSGKIYLSSARSQIPPERENGSKKSNTGTAVMTLPRLRNDLDVARSPVPDRPGLLLRDFFRYSDATLIIPPLLVPGLSCFDGKRTESDLRAELTRSSGSPEVGNAARQMVEALSEAGFLEDETYATLKEKSISAFVQSPIRQAVHAGSAYPAEVEPLRRMMEGYLEGADPSQTNVMGIAAPHVSPHGGWQSYRAAYKELTPDLRDRTFVVLGTSHYGRPNKFGLTRKRFETPYGTTTIDLALVDELASQPAVLMEDYCHAVEHSIEFQVVFLQTIYGPNVRILPILCGSFGHSVHNGGAPEDNGDVEQFLSRLRQVATQENSRLFWVLGVDMAHMGNRYGDNFAAHADREEMNEVRRQDQLRIERVLASDAHGFWNLVKQNRQDDLKWCGSSPIYTFLRAVPRARGTLLRYEQWNIDENSVVTFAGISFTG
jgi:AmmeMemoRadiSam system protein B